MTVVEFQCPSCTTALRTANENLLGKKIRCPKCSSPCPVPAASVPEPALSVSESALPEAPVGSSASDDSLPPEFSLESPDSTESEFPESSEPEWTPEPESELESDVSSDDFQEPELGEPAAMTPTVYGSDAMNAHLGESKPASAGSMMLSAVLFVVWMVVVGVASYALLNLDLSRTTG